MEVDTGKLLNCIYNYEFELYTSDDNTILVSSKTDGRIVSIDKKDDPILEKRMMPLLILNINLSEEEIIKLQNNRTKLLCKLDLTSRNMKAGGIGQKAAIEYKVFNEIFQANIDMHEIKAIPLKDKKDAKGSEENGYSAASAKEPIQLYTVKLYLYKLSTLNLFKTRKSFIFNKCTILGAISALFTKYNLENVILDTPDNEEEYDQIIIPPGNIKENIMHLQTVYGIYKSGYIFYTDINRIYLIKKINKNYNYEKNDYNRVELLMADLSANNAGPKGKAYYKDDTKSKYIITQDNIFEMKDYSEMKKESLGNKFQIYSNKLAQQSLQYEDASNKWTFSKPYIELENELSGNIKSEDNIRIIENPLSNDYIAEEAMLDMKTSSLLLVKPTENIDYKILTFNKIYNLEFLYGNSEFNKNKKGEYGLISMESILFKPKDKYILQPMSILVLAKI